MKRLRGKAGRAVLAEAPTAFARGFLVTGLLAAMQDRRGKGAPDGATLLRHALQGGAALAAGTVAAEALARRNPALAAIAVAAGAAGVLAAETLLNSAPADEFKENRLGQEEE